MRRAQSVRALLLALSAFAVAACGPNEPDPQHCRQGLVLCGTQCIDLANDAASCGLCGNACQAPLNGGAASCVMGACEPTCSTAGFQLCDAAPAADGGITLSCTDSKSDPNHCGGCQTQCGPNETCFNGSCIDCPAGMLRCPAGAGMAPICLAILSDNANCGACGKTCATGTTCDNGACVTIGQSNCGNADGGAASSANLQTDRANCGACGNTCANAETCTSGRCEPCPVAQCNNACTDTSSDPRNCGGCGTGTVGTYTCTDGEACIAGGCSAPVRVEMLGPADGGIAPVASPFTQLIQVDSALPVSRVFVDGPQFGTLADGGPVTRANATYSGPGATGSGESFWSIIVPPQTVNAHFSRFITATAQDDAYTTASAADKPHHQAVATAVVNYQPAFTANEYVPAISVTSGGVTLPSGSFIPLGAPTVVISVQAPAVNSHVTDVNFIMTNNSGQTVQLGAGTLSGGNVVLQVQPSQMLLGPSVLTAFAFVSDGEFQNENLGQFNLTVGSIEPAIDTPIVTRDGDAGTSNIWWLASSADGGTALVASTRYDLPVAGGALDAGASDAGYFADSLTASIDPSAVFAVSTTGFVDRFACAGSSSSSCYQHAYVQGLTARRIVAETLLGLALVDSDGKLWFAPAGGGAATSTGGTLVGTPKTSASGAIFAATDSRSGATPYHFVVYGGQGVQQVGAALPNAPSFAVFSSGEFVWSWVNADKTKGTLSAGSFDGITLSTVSSPLTTGPSAGTYIEGALLARPGVIIGSTTAAILAPSGGVSPGSQPALFIADVKASSLTFPIQSANAQTGALQLSYSQTGANIGLGGRDGQLRPWVVSDDQLKALVVTRDTATNADGTTTSQYSLWLIDLLLSSASLVYTTPNLLPYASPDSNPCGGAVASAMMAPHFVHSAAGAVSAVQGGTPSTSIAAVPAIVFEEVLDAPAGSSSGSGLYPVRLYSAKYQATGAALAAQAVDRFASLSIGSTSYANCDVVRASSGGTTYPTLSTVPFEAETTANGGAFFFIGATAGGANALFVAPLFTGTGVTLTSTMLLDSALDFRTREDTGKLLALRGDGNLYAGSLGPMPSLSLLLTGGGSGSQPSLSLSGQASFGFTSDGTHAYLAVQPGGQVEDANGGNLMNSVLQLVDLTSAKRTDYGQLTYGLGNLALPAVFLNNSATMFGLSATALGEGNGTATLDLYGALAAAGTRHFQLGLEETVLDGSSSNNNSSSYVSYALFANPEQSLDGSEGRVSLVPRYYQNSFFAQPINATQHTAFLYKDGTLFDGPLARDGGIVTTFYASPATYSPFGGPYTPDFELYESALQGNAAVLARVSPDLGIPTSPNIVTDYFKRWGIVNGAAQLPLKLATGSVSASAVTTKDLSLIRAMFQSIDGKYAPALVTLTPHTPPSPPLP